MNKCWYSHTSILILRLMLRRARLFFLLNTPNILRAQSKDAKVNYGKENQPGYSAAVQPGAHPSTTRRGRRSAQDALREILI